MGFTANMLSTYRLMRRFSETDDVRGVKRAVALFCLQNEDFLSSLRDERELMVEEAFKETTDLPVRDITCHKVDLLEWLTLMNACTDHVQEERRIPMVLGLLHSRFANVSVKDMMEEIRTVDRIDDLFNMRYSDDYPLMDHLKVVKDMARLAEKTAKAMLESEIKEELEDDPSELVLNVDPHIELERRPHFVHFEVDDPCYEESFVATVARTKSGEILLAMTPLFEYLDVSGEGHIETLEQHLERMSGQLIPEVDTHYRYFRKYGIFSLVSTMTDKHSLEHIIKASAYELSETQEAVDALIEDFEDLGAD